MLLALSALLIPIKSPFVAYDEGYAVFHATRIMNGDLPHKDFWTVYPPGQFYALAMLFRTLGAALLVSRLYDTVVRPTIAFSAFLIAERTTSRSAAPAGSVTAAVLLAVAGFDSYTLLPALAVSLLSLLRLIEYIRSGAGLFSIYLFSPALRLALTICTYSPFRRYSLVARASCIP